MAAEQRLTPTERANLVAYLDGELNEAEARAIATKLTLSPTARREVEVLEKTWELLDHLPRSKASDHLTARTLSEVRVLDQQGGRFESAARQVARRVSRALLWSAASLLAFGLGYLLIHWLWPDRTARLARDLTIAEHLDEYQDVGSFDFLRALSDSPEFGSDRD